MQRDEGDSLRKGRLEKLNRRLARYVDKMRQLLIDRVRELDDSLTQFEFARLLKDLGIPEADAVQVFVFVDTDEDQKITLREFQFSFGDVLSAPRRKTVVQEPDTAQKRRTTTMVLTNSNPIASGTNVITDDEQTQTQAMRGHKVAQNKMGGFAARRMTRVS